MPAPPIKPRTLKGFRDYLPQAMIARESLIETARRVYRAYGYCPIDTPALEYLEILEGKGGEESNKQLYQFQDQGGRDVALRFDLTVPLARFVAQHASTLGMPFKRYHIATVWRGENTQMGRYREFMQCDFDIIGTESVAADIETALVIHDLMEALGFQRFTVRLNSRRVLNGLLEKLGLSDSAVAILRALDKLSKIGPQRVRAEMEATAGTSSAQSDAVLELSLLEGSNAEILRRVKQLVAGNQQATAGAERLAEVLAGIEAVGVPGERIQLDVSIARGLDYYTGLIYETFLDDLPGIGSVCSGGRYDNLVGLFSKQVLPGVGASLGLDRLLAAMEQLDMIAKERTPADVIIPFFDPHRLADYLKLAAILRRAGLAVEVYPEPKKLGQQLKYADSRGFAVALIAGAHEFEAQTCQIKNLRAGESVEVSTRDDFAELIAAVRQLVEQT